MRSRTWLALLLVPLAALPAIPADKGKGTPAADITWKKTVLDSKFRSEGVAVADVNKDGKMDVLTGELVRGARLEAARHPQGLEGRLQRRRQERLQPAASPAGPRTSTATAGPT